MKWYPIIFKPIYKEKIWGGSKLNDLKSLDSPISKLGESWEISDVGDTISVVSNGELAGISLNELLEKHSLEVLGKRVKDRFGKRFPLLIKYIDTARDLSVQLHPDDETAQKKHGSFGKTEMWYVMDAQEDARLTLGFEEASSKSAFAKAISSNNVPALLNYENVKPGESFLIQPGFIHAIGAGVTLAEIQQSSDITYRIYDYERTDDDGNQRELHIEDSIAMADYSKAESYRLNYDHDTLGVQELAKTSYFETFVLQFTGRFNLELKSGSSFTILMNVGEACELIHDGQSYGFGYAQTYLIPAALKDLQANCLGQGKLLTVSI
ncbi:mannose-6-phosphate isomerase, type 1 [Nonlabens sp. Hel1_33_55]|uniref:type I phosphomannose isomerase catalytic subunit n=1 Tax=Nonlabens sp. Hel1_33_55 TaxID=1336802 RepID=UPI000875D49F|nr:type I phosphomannose isomerase catalytic subunit [Nonlabens sp. Hel1_33_55]SCX86926.1 mannose-6-phosphate isomerase, type 1 [Nonlabens sp. Hel1_33_55]